MNDYPKIPISGERVRRLAHKAWSQQIASDSQEPNLEMLAAYVDGGLDEAGRDYVARHVAESPRAWAVLHALLAPGQAFPFVGERESPPQAGKSSVFVQRGPSGVFRRRAEPYYLVAVAASLLLAVTLGGRAWQLAAERNELAGHVARLERAEASRRDTVWQLVRQQKSRVSEVAAELGPPVFVGSSDPRQMLGELERSLAARSRGPNDGEQSRLDAAAAAAQDTIEWAADAVPANSLVWKIDEVAVLITTGKFDDAERLLVELESRSADDPRVQNARGAWLVHRALRTPRNQAEPLLTRAEPLLKSATGGEPLAWLNLFELYRIRGDQAQAAAAVHRFAEGADDAALRAFVQEQFGPAP